MSSGNPDLAIFPLSSERRGWAGCRRFSEIIIRLVAHDDLQDSSLQDILMGDIAFAIWLAVQFKGADIDIGSAVVDGLHGE